jgi:hypothetical protein
MFKCPCCGYPTLERRDMQDTCYLCKWEDDGQGDEDAHLIYGGPNSDYSLLEVRNNFKKYLIMYRPNDNRFKFFKNEEIDEIKKNIMNYLNKVNMSDQVTLSSDITQLKMDLNIEENKLWAKYHQ